MQKKTLCVLEIFHLFRITKDEDARCQLDKNVNLLPFASAGNCCPGLTRLLGRFTNSEFSILMLVNG